MEYERKCINVAWLLENVKWVWQMDLHSPVISVDEMEGTQWKLEAILKTPSKIQLSIRREAEDNGPEEFGLVYQFFVKTFRGTFLTGKSIHTHTFKKDQKGQEFELDTTRMKNRVMKRTILAFGNITIKCKIWRQNGSLSKYHEIFVQTRMRIEHCAFVGVVENFSSFSEDEMVTLKTISSSTGERVMTVSLSFFRPLSLHITMFRQIKLEIVIIAEDNQTRRFCDFKLFILDSLGNKTDIGKLEGKYILKSVESLTLPDVWQEDLMEENDKYLPNDTLSLHCEIEFCSGIEHEKVEMVEIKTAETKIGDFATAVETLTSKEGMLCDTKIQTATETFSVHTSILSAKSPVFEAMFNTNMKETVQKCIHIDDVDVETVKRMLMFMYMDTLDELDWKDATKLYIVADKYQILTLKEKCSALLKLSIDLSNCYVLMLTAYHHQDNNLKKSLWNFIVHHRKKVVYCEQWRDMEDNHPKVVIEILRDLLIEKYLFDMF